MEKNEKIETGNFIEELDILSYEDEVIELDEDIDLSEDQQKIEKLSKKQRDIVENVVDWLFEKRNYRNNDIDASFKADKIIPLIPLIEGGLITFHEKGITQKLRVPIQLLDKKGNVNKKIDVLEYRTRYQALELNQYTRGINLSKEMNLYMDAQVAVLTNNPRGLIGKLFDLDHSTTRIIQSLYFL